VQIYSKANQLRECGPFLQQYEKVGSLDNKQAYTEAMEILVDLAVNRNCAKPFYRQTGSLRCKRRSSISDWWKTMRTKLTQGSYGRETRLQPFPLAR